MVRTQSVRKSLGWVQIGIALLAVATGVLHLYLSSVVYASGGNGMMFLLNGLGYLGLLAALFLPIPLAVRLRPWIRYALMAYTLITIIAWVFVGARNLTGYLDKLIEVALLVLLWLDRGRDV